MKNTTLLKILTIVFVFIATASFSQDRGVGIGTLEPRATLEVAGAATLRDGFDIKVIEPLTDEDKSSFLMQENNSNIRKLDVSNPTGAALGYIQKYEIYNPNEDWVRDLDTSIDANDFVVNTISANYDRELDIGNYSTIPYFAAIIKTNSDGSATWHITADFPAANNLDSDEIGTWTITTLIYSRDLSKQLGKIEYNMNNTTTGSVSTPIIN
ncbi:hypothetical protein [Leeuwenhoekiella aestuarii]|uniref:Uncharacterized protein n=1 Tax=Leeuwenhoekiella aestuarii TaxID=2249426 RepID=A0A4Q0NVJ1_9FLAO|nr:hypothetical protein [Leeuwenhoekiella aestuarii]RXG15296.1 hypothetical protein DSM04_103184 [Leeuwenhoekiella aestuarii]